MPWAPQPRQLAALEADWCSEIFYGGERGSGKSDLQLGAQEDAALRYGAAHKGILIRRSYGELEELQHRATQIFPGSGASYHSAPSRESPASNCWRWQNGASLKMRYLESDSDYLRYHGHQYSLVGLDEVPEYPSDVPVLRMISTLRSPEGIPCRMICTGNPGGRGHGWVKARYIDRSPPMIPFKDPESGLERIFIPARLDDNQKLMAKDPGYRARLLAATQGNEALRKAWLRGDWDIPAGQFFSGWARDRNVIQPVDLPDRWVRIVSGDWGSAKPYAFYRAVVAQEPVKAGAITVPKGGLIVMDELYGIEEDQYGVFKPNHGSREYAEQVGQKLARWSAPNSAVLDPAAFSEDGGPSIAERLYLGSGRKIQFRPADNARVARRGAIGGWDQMRSMLHGEDEDKPMLVFFNTCIHAIRTIPMMQHSASNVEDIDSSLEDHAADSIRYLCMSRPHLRAVDSTKARPAYMSYDWMYRNEEKKKSVYRL